mmetsp:Transcript_7829/g.33281  ORF Transcript_7829/g.33281 Transcript_7829/m.33281 type:complete len:205 (+) Transcript_7829:497-1111(+)
MAMNSSLASLGLPSKNSDASFMPSPLFSALSTTSTRVLRNAARQRSTHKDKTEMIRLIVSKGPIATMTTVAMHQRPGDMPSVSHESQSMHSTTYSGKSNLSERTLCCRRKNSSNRISVDSGRRTAMRSSKKLRLGRYRRNVTSASASLHAFALYLCFDDRDKPSRNKSRRCARAAPSPRSASAASRATPSPDADFSPSPLFFSS